MFVLLFERLGSLIHHSTGVFSGTPERFLEGRSRVVLPQL
jgi:hypothetical protein